jgi:2-polyprenyl-3-methyl-5-hydroxy-6-metoxy-1,4-benzoquinol methylase
MRGFLSRREADLVEWMDRPDCDPHRLESTYRRFPWVNRWIAGWGRVYRSALRPLLPRDRPARLLDVGCGGGDIARNLLRWSSEDGFDLRIVGIDPDPRALRFAQHPRDAKPEPRLEFRQATASDLAERGERFDLVITNHVLHHLAPPALPDFLASLQALALRRVVLSDIERSRLGYLLFSAAALPIAGNSYLRTDGLISIRKSYTADELRQVLPSEWRVERHPPFRLWALWDSPTATSVP